MEFKTDALVLRAVDYGENDKMVTLLTSSAGKLGACMKGVKKAGAKLRFAAQPFCFAEYVVAERNGRHTVISASLYDGFFPLCEDMERYYAAAVVCEACDKLMFEGMPSGELLVAAVSALKEMCEGDAAFALVVFLTAALRLAGYPIRADVPPSSETRYSPAPTRRGEEGDVPPSSEIRHSPSPTRRGEEGDVPSSSETRHSPVPIREGGERDVLAPSLGTRYSPAPTCGGGVGEGATAFPALFFNMESGSFSLEKGVPASAVTYHTLRRAMGLPSPDGGREGEKRALRLLYSYFAYQTDSELTSLPDYVRML